MARSLVRYLLVAGLLASGLHPCIARAATDGWPWTLPLADTAKTAMRTRAPLDAFVALPIASGLPALGASRGTRASHELVADPNLWGTDGNVLDMARSGNTLYIAGAFRSVGENSGGLVPTDSRSGQPLRPFPKVDGFVYTIVPDGAGGWYIGGQFTTVGGKTRSNVAQLRADVP